MLENGCERTARIVRRSRVKSTTDSRFNDFSSSLAKKVVACAQRAGAGRAGILPAVPSILLGTQRTSTGVQNRVHASKSRWRPRASPGWSTRLACCFRRPAGNTPSRMRNHTGSANRCALKSARHSRTHAHRASAASRRRPHASRMLHPEEPPAVCNSEDLRDSIPTARPPRPLSQTAPTSTPAPAG